MTKSVYSLQSFFVIFSSNLKPEVQVKVQVMIPVEFS